MENSINIHVPVTVSYTALQAVLQQKVVGEYIPDPNKEGDASAYGQVLAVAMGASKVATYDVVLALKVKIMRTLMKRDNVDLLVYAALGYDNDRQLVYVKKYKVDVRTQSSFYNAALEVLANNVAYERVMKKARIDLRERLGQEVGKVNGRLATGLEIKGARITGAVSQVLVQDLTPHADHLSLSVMMKGDVQTEIFDLSSLLDAQQDARQDAQQDARQA